MQNDTTQTQTLPMTGTINSRIGLLGFEGGYPAEESVAKLYDELDFQRAVQIALSAGMTTKTPGQGQVFIGIEKDKDGYWLQGGNRYTLHIPPNPPVKQFWALTLYDVETRRFIDTPHDLAGLDSRKKLDANADGSVDLYFGPAAPASRYTTRSAATGEPAA